MKPTKSPFLSLMVLFVIFTVAILTTPNSTLAAKRRRDLSFQKFRKLMLTCQEDPFNYGGFQYKNKTSNLFSQFAEKIINQQKLGISAEVEFNKTLQKNKIISTLLVQWTTPQRKSVIEGLTINDFIKWNGITMQSAKFITSPKLSYELLYNLTDDIYVIRQAPTGGAPVELQCELL